MDQAIVRSVALLVTGVVHLGDGSPPSLVAHEADRYAAWIAGGPGPAAQFFLAAEVDGILVPSPRHGGNMPVSIAATVDNNTVIITVLPEDDHGDATSDQLTFANDDTASAVATWAADATGHVYTGTLTHAEGTVNITVTDPSASALAPLELQLVVGPGATSQLVATSVVS